MLGQKWITIPPVSRLLNRLPGKRVDLFLHACVVKKQVTKGEIISDPRINERIRVAQVRLVGPAGEQVGVVDIDQALKLAREADLDLVEVFAGLKPTCMQDHGLRQVQV